MRGRTEALALLAGSGVADLAMRITQVALPLVILHETGDVAATGLIGGATGVPVLLSPWWARKARQWVDSGPRLAVIAAVQALALATVPAAATLGLLTPGLLVVSGLLLGCGEALSSPGRSALLADTGDRWGPGKAVVLLTWQDGLRRIGMMIGPVIGTLAMSTGLTNGLLWLQA
jgi:MFS family permease